LLFIFVDELLLLVIKVLLALVSIDFISFLTKYVDEDEETPDEDAVDDLSIKFSLFKFLQLLLLLQSVRSKSSFIIKLSSLQEEYFDDIVDEVDVCDVVIILFVIELNGGLSKDEEDDNEDDCCVVAVVA
jgi:hypothetical protein